MYICPNCGKAFEEPVNFCNGCGANLSGTAAPVAPPVYTPVTPVYAVPATPAVSGGSNAKHIVGMILGISGMVTSIIGLLYALILLPEATDYHYFYNYAAEALTGVCMVFAFIALPLSIVGLALSRRKAFGVVGTIISGILFMLGLIATGF